MAAAYSSEKLHAKTQTTWNRGHSVSGSRDLMGQRAKLEMASLEDLDGSDVVAVQAIRQQARLRRNIHCVDSDVAWRTALRSIVTPRCGTVVFFRRHGCPSCNCMAPKFSEASNDFEALHSSEVSFLEVDVDKCRRTAAVFHADALAPHFIIFRHGEQCESFSGVSTQVFQTQIEQLRVDIMACSRCTGEMRTGFDALEQQFCEVVQSGQLYGGRPLRILQWREAGAATFEDLVSSGEKIVPFDINNLNEPVRPRLEVLEERLHAPPSLFDLSRVGRHNSLALQFIAAHGDEGLQIDCVRSTATHWLADRCGHPSLWETEERQAATSITDAAVARRAARAEYWLLHSLAGIEGRISSRRKWSEHLRSSLYSKMCEVWLNVRPCPGTCKKCELPCVLTRNHVHDHCCGTEDHRCHRLVQSDANEPSRDACGSRRPRLRCQLHGGHSGPCTIEAPSRDPGDEQVCAICLDELPRPVCYHIANEHGADGSGDQPMVVFPCKHDFHLRCAEPWLQRSSVCPLCRSPTGPSTFRRNLASARGNTGLARSLGRHGSSAHVRRVRHLANAAADVNVHASTQRVHLPTTAEDASSPFVSMEVNGSPHALSALNRLSASVGFLSNSSATTWPALPPVNGRDVSPANGVE